MNEVALNEVASRRVASGSVTRAKQPRSRPISCNFLHGALATLFEGHYHVAFAPRSAALSAFQHRVVMSRRTQCHAVLNNERNMISCGTISSGAKSIDVMSSGRISSGAWHIDPRSVPSVLGVEPRAGLGIVCPGDASRKGDIVSLFALRRNIERARH